MGPLLKRLVVPVLATAMDRAEAERREGAEGAALEPSLEGQVHSQMGRHDRSDATCLLHEISLAP